MSLARPSTTIIIIIILLMLGSSAPLQGCATPRDRPASETGASFPHDDGIMLPGIDVEALGACYACHASGLDPDSGLGGGGAIPSCDACHQTFPHQGDCIPTHGDEWLRDSEACETCHGQDGAKDPSTSSVDTCTGCHSAFPHRQGWVMPYSHGARVVDRGSDTSCASCHAAADCQSCHQAYPHEEGFVSSHGETGTAAGCGGYCHDGSQVGAPGELVCSACHGDRP